MMRTTAGAVEIEQVLLSVAPWLTTPELAQRLRRRLRPIAGHWVATAYGTVAIPQWPVAAGHGE